MQGHVGPLGSGGVISLDEHYRILRGETGGESGGATFGLFNRNMVVSGRAHLDPLTPAYQEAPGAINLGEITAYPETFGELVDQAEASAIVVAPTGNDLASKTTYWTASTDADYILYSHPHLPRTIRAYSFITENGYTPATWKLEGSNNGTDWTVLHSGTAPEWGAGKVQVDEDIASGNIASYLYHKLTFLTFDASAVRIYALQLWTDGITTQLGARLFASSTDPLIIAFGNGETVEEVVFTSPVTGVFDPAGTPAHASPLGATAYSLVAYVEYDPLTQETVLGAEQINVDDYIKLGSIRTALSALGWTIAQSGWNASYPFTNMFDGNWTSDSRTATGVYTGHVTFIAPVGVTFAFIGAICKPRFHATTSGLKTYLQYTVDRGTNWITYREYENVSGSTPTYTDFADSPIVVNGIRYFVPYQSSYAGAYELEIYCFDIPGIGTAGRKFGNGIVQLYDSENEQWVQKNRVYMGTLNMGKGLDGEWAVNGFVPFNMPPQNLVPFPKQTFPARW